MRDDLFKDVDDISQVGSANKYFYDIINEPINLYYDSQIGYYSTRLSIDPSPKWLPKIEIN